MAQQYTSASGAGAVVRMNGAPTALIQLSDGTPVWVENDNDGNRQLCCSTDRSTVTVIGLLISPLKGCAPSGIIPSMLAASWPLSVGTNVTVSPGAASM